MSLPVRQIEVTDAAYAAMLELRDKILRRPLGLSISQDDLSLEADDIKLIAEEGDSVAGCVLLKKLGNGRLKLRAMAVDDTRQKSGIGWTLVRAAEQVAVQQGYKIIELHARVVAVPFYEKQGYVVTGDVFTEVGIPHLFMQKTIA